MDTRYEIEDAAGTRPIVYVRPVKVAELPEDLRAQAPEGLSEIYAVHDEDGERLALVGDRQLAFILANQNDLVPVSVH